MVGIQIPDAADPSDAVLAAFLREPYPAGPRHVDLLRLFAAGAVVWAAAAGSAALAAPVKLLHAKYLGALDRWIQRLPEAKPPPSSEEQRQELLSGADGGEKEEPSMDCNGRGQQHQQVVFKRKREDVAGMLDWVRGLAQSVSEEGAAAAGLADGYFSAALAVARKRARRASVTNGALLQLLRSISA